MAKKIVPKRVKKQIKAYLQVLTEDGMSVQKVFLFGSYAKGKQHKWSDIDLCIISKDLQKKQYPWEYLWRKTAQLPRTRIEPVGYTPKDFVDECPLAWEIKQTGIRII